VSSSNWRLIRAARIFIGPRTPSTNASCARILLAVPIVIYPEKISEAGNVIETHEHKGDFKEW
jgi:hypothetical protein